MRQPAKSMFLPRRDFLRQSALLGLAAGTGAGVIGDARAAAVENVVAHGAKGDGMTNDTAAFRSAIAAVSAGGIVRVPMGTYLLNANPDYCVSLKSNMKLELQPGAKLKAMRSTLERHFLIWIANAQNVEVYGLGTGDEIGEIIGERDEHEVEVGEEGRGIQIVGSANITISNLRISKFRGDGILLGRLLIDDETVNSAYVTVSGVVCTNNRRQGMSITGADHVEVSDSEFSWTSGTLPQAGIDIEPRNGNSVSDVLIRRCVLANNAGNGIEFNSNSDAGFVISGVEVRNNDIMLNGGYGIFSNHVDGSWLVQNRIEENDLKGVRIAALCRDHAIGQNTFVNNSLSTVPPGSASDCIQEEGHQSGITGRHIEVVAGAVNINLNLNTYCPAPA